MNICIIGGAGYIGSKLIEKLSIYNDYEITVIDNFYYKQYKVLDRINGEFKLIQQDCREYNEYHKYDVIFPLAAYVGMPICNKIDSNEVIGLNTFFIKDLCRKVSHQQVVIFPNTNSSYGNSDYIICDEKSTRKPISLYAETKDNAEDYVLSKPNGIVFRLATVMGISPRNRWDLLVNNLTKIAIENGELSIFEPEFKRNFIHVNDVCNAFIHAMNNSAKLRNEVFNLGMDKCNMTKGQLATEISNIVGCEYKVIEGTDLDKRNYLVSSEKLKKFGFEATIGIDETVKEIQEYLSNNKVCNWESNI